MKVSMWFGLLLGLLLTGNSSFGQGTEVAPGVLLVGTIQGSDISESSGLITSKRARGLYWTHNDGGADAVFALGSDGTVTGQYKLKDTEMDNCEDIAAKGGLLYLADIGNNTGSRDSVEVLAIPEPNPRRSGEVRPVKRWQLEYPNSPFDAESFFISKGYGYVIEKESGNAHVYRFKMAGRGAKTLEEQCELNMDAPAAGADLTSDNRRLAVISNQGAYLFELPGRVPSEGTLEPSLFVPYALDQMEGCTFTRDGLLVTAESGQILLFTDPLFRTQK